jgi:hypothetical protein
VNLYELAKKVNPGNLCDHEGKVIWKSSNGRFAYMIRIDDVVYLRMSFSQAQLAFYVLLIEEWDIATVSSYKEIAELWQTESKEIGKAQSLEQSSYL